MGEKGLAEPIVVLSNKNKNEYVIADGHHRTVAAYELGKDEIQSYILEPSEPIEIGMLKTAEKNDLYKISDIKVSRQDSHLIVENIKMF